MSIKGKKDIVFGKFDLDADEFAPQKVKTRITTLVDDDALTEFKKIADHKGVKYQTLLNQVIRSFVGARGKVKPIREKLTEESVRQIVRQELKRRA